MISPYPKHEDVDSRVLLLVTTRRDAEITERLLKDVGLTARPCETLHALGTEIAIGASALLMTEESVSGWRIKDVVDLLREHDRDMDLPTVVLTKGGTRSAVAAALMARLENLMILERPAPISSIVSAVQAAVRVRARQREMAQQIARTQDLQLQLTLALDVSELGTFHCELPWGKILWNDRCKSHFWLPPEAEVDIDKFFALLHPEDRERTRRAIEANVERKEKYDTEYRTVSPEGKIRWVRATGNTLFNEAGEAVQFSGTTQDVTGRKEWEEQRDQLLASERAARVAGERANRLKDEFLATLSHELRTPLNAVMGWVELLKAESDDPAIITEGVAVIERNVRAQAKLIDDLLDVSRIISGKVRLEIKPLNLAEVIDAAVETVRPTALAKGVRLETVVNSAPSVNGDFGRLQQTIWNLLTNAIKFTPRGGRVQVFLEQSGSSSTVSVTDTGEGIEPEFLPHVFERFRQADGSASRKHSGLGLGLSIVKTLVEMHGGAVAVQSRGKGLGSSFRVNLPLRIVKAEASVRGGRETPTSPFTGVPSNRPNLSGLRVLVVDDEPDARDMMRRLLSTCRATSLEASNAETALKLAGESQPDLILSDIGMPGMDGYQFIREARRRGVAVPAVALTAFARSEDRIRSIQSGFQAHLTKPIEPAELLAVIASLAGRRPEDVPT